MPEDLCLVFSVPNSPPPLLPKTMQNGCNLGPRINQSPGPQSRQQRDLSMAPIVMSQARREVLPCLIKIMFGGDFEVQRSFLSQQADVAPTE